MNYDKSHKQSYKLIIWFSNESLRNSFNLEDSTTCKIQTECTFCIKLFINQVRQQFRTTISYTFFDIIE